MILVMPDMMGWEEDQEQNLADALTEESPQDIEQREEAMAQLEAVRLVAESFDLTRETRM